MRPRRRLAGHLGNGYSLLDLGLGGALTCAYLSTKTGTVECREGPMTPEDGFHSSAFSMDVRELG